jgi:ribonuclease T2
MRTFITFLVLTICFLLAIVLKSPAQEREFDYYLLSMAWSPTFCQDHGDNEECTKPRGFILHGLWPQYESGSYPRHCERHGYVPDAVIDDMLPIMPSKHLILHEWMKHGACTGLEPSIYFGNAKNVFNNVTIPTVLQRTSEERTMTQREITDAFIQANSGLDENMVEITCNNDTLNEVRICLDKSGKARKCGALHDYCQTDKISIPAHP